MSEENKKILTNIEAKWVGVDRNTITVTIPEVKGEFKTNLKELVKYGEYKYDIKIVLNYTLDSSSSFYLYFLEEIELKSLSIECDLKPSDNKYYGDTRLKISNNFMIQNLKTKELKLKNIEFNTKCDLFDIEVDKLIIDNCIFNDTFSITSMQDSYVKNPIKKQFAKHILAKNIKFNSGLECAYNIFETLDISKSEIIGSANFKNCDFQEIQSKEERKKNKEKTFHDFSEVVFKENAYFDDSYFNEFVAFHLCVFEKTASFYRTKFNVIPNFSQVNLNNILNMVNADWGDDNNLKIKNIDDMTRKIQKKDDEYVNSVRDIRDSFCSIKDKLLKANNQLEAQKFHKAELYCKELELEKENKNFSTFIDSLLLKFYRNTSDHHTNFLKILNFTVFCIAVYAVCSFVFIGIYEATFFGDAIIFSKNISWNIFSYLSVGLIFLTMIILLFVFNAYEVKKFFKILLLFFIFILITIFANVCFIKNDRIILLLDAITFLYLFISNIKSKELKLFAFMLCCFSIIPLLSSVVYFSLDKDKNYDFLFNITIPSMISTYFCLAIFFSYWLVEKYLCKIKYKDFVLLISKCIVWCIVAFVLYLSPQLINPFVGVFKSDEILSKNYFEKKLNDLNASEIMEISNLLKNDTDLNVTAIHKEIIDLNTITNTEIINAKELIKQRIGDISIDDNVSNNTVTRLKEAKEFQEYLVNGIKSSSLVYSIILLLCLYSLTKTARKNSIVPI